MQKLFYIALSVISIIWMLTKCGSYALKDAELTKVREGGLGNIILMGVMNPDSMVFTDQEATEYVFFRN